MRPGDALSATGKGCAPGERVTLTSGGQSDTLVVLVFFVLAGITVIRFP
ncbi:hypothetical protein ACFORH_34290 [Amycolatopsis roodepoortensis]|uniref:Uncharacterized protein n=1 Tax=Amycolatopsis roodepoortensis TaxID=700274 RepID=A0ABR9L0Q0_9PSEU|nr:hypothetical protein [Amycolatopsis roodepoortensis]MBE1574194.1 hypothetical protein [Amycolatopsis roodepoortensis]